MSPKIIDEIYKRQQLKNYIFISLTFKLQDVEPTKFYDIKKGFQKKYTFMTSETKKQFKKKLETYA